MSSPFVAATPTSSPPSPAFGLILATFIIAGALAFDLLAPLILKS
jgi:hypothetical protein